MFRFEGFEDEDSLRHSVLAGGAARGPRAEPRPAGADVPAGGLRGGEPKHGGHDAVLQRGGHVLKSNTLVRDCHREREPEPSALLALLARSLSCCGQKLAFPSGAMSSYWTFLKYTPRLWIYLRSST